MLDVLDNHTHTTASGHAYNTIYEMAQSASRKGLALLGISDHGPAMEGSASKHYFRSSRCIPRELYGVKILFGCELNIMDYDGGVDLDEVFAGALDYGIASLHDVCITPGSRAENTRAYLKAMENPKVHIIGHPDDGTYAVDFDELVRHARERGVMIELNEASVRPGSYRKNGRENAAVVLSNDSLKRKSFVCPVCLCRFVFAGDCRLKTFHNINQRESRPFYRKESS